MSHLYLSTYCLHDLHEECRLTCKMCASPCVCACHDHDPRFSVPAREEARRQRKLLVVPWENRVES